MGLGRKGLRVANTPMRLAPPSRGGLTVGYHFSEVPRLFSVCTSLAISTAVPPGVPFSNSQMSHRYVKPSIPSTAEFRANSGSKMMVPCKCGARKLFRGMPNFCGISVWMCAIGFMVAILPQRQVRFLLLRSWLYGLLYLVHGAVGLVLRRNVLESKCVFGFSELWCARFVSGKICSIGLGDTRGSLWNKQTISKR